MYSVESVILRVLSFLVSCKLICIWTFMATNTQAKEITQSASFLEKIISSSSCSIYFLCQTTLIRSLLCKFTLKLFELYLSKSWITKSNCFEYNIWKTDYWQCYTTNYFSIITTLDGAFSFSNFHRTKNMKLKRRLTEKKWPTKKFLSLKILRLS